ncbi:MAG TPA: HEAT repeat domain-containing protein [Gammaproteobacteria bacterium]|nr:HEAT repeat domain-containing protein [Gammaproteobacteria bacterium]
MRAIVLFAVLLAARAVLGETLAERVAAAPDGIVRMSFPAREGVCGNGGGSWTSRDGQDRAWSCDGGPARVQLEKNGARIVRLEPHVGGSWRPRDGVTDLGDVDAAAAQDFYLDLVGSSDSRIAEAALLPAVMADASDPWQRLLGFARSSSLARNLRKQAIFWLGQSAAREATAGLAAIADGDPETEVQKAAVFALSQGREPTRVDALVKVARNHRNPEVVQSALFWLAQSEDPRAVDLFEEILEK